ncbi:MAG TPA: dockerin type I domain-containing protein [Anaerolineae bacterium]|nr:dockerin type I domain-containing protein [Anaerolineae bacterium]
MLARKLSILVVLTALVLSVSAPSASAQPPSTYAAISVTGVTSGSPAIGSNFTTDVQVSITTTGPGLVGMELYLFYSPGLVSPVDTDSSLPAVQPAELRSGFFGTSPIPAANEVITGPDVVAPGVPAPGRVCPGGSYPCIHLSLVGPAQTNKTDTVARLHWSGVGVGFAVFTILNPVVTPPPFPAPPRTALSDADGFLIPISSYNATGVAIVQGGSIIGIVDRQGVPPAAGPGSDGCTQIDATNGAVVAVPGFTLVTPPPDLPAQVNTAGGFLITLPTAGTYTVRASYPGYLQAHKPNVFASAGQANIGTTRLVGGDVNGDNAINILDIVAIIGRLGTSGPTVPVRSSAIACVAPWEGSQTPVAPPPDSAFDINDDGNVDISDLSIAAGNFGKVGPTAWAP